MSMSIGRQFVRWTALLVLLNIALGFCACLRDPVIPSQFAGSPMASPDTHRDGIPACGDNCESCICCAAVMVAAPAQFPVSLAVSFLAASPKSDSSDPDLISITYPPRV